MLAGMLSLWPNLKDVQFAMATGQPLRGIRHGPCSLSCPFGTREANITLFANRREVLEKCFNRIIYPCAIVPQPDDVEPHRCETPAARLVSAL